jgi:hypothetical protein
VGFGKCWVSGESRSVVAKGGLQLLLLPSKGVEFTCGKVEGKVRIENTSEGGAGKFGKIKYTGCRAETPKPGECQIKSPGEKAGNITTEENIETKLVEYEGESGVGDELYHPEGSRRGTFVKLDISLKSNETSACGLLPLKSIVTKTLVGKVKGGMLNFTEPPQRGSSLVFEELNTSFEIVGEVSQELEGGGAIRAS